ncbi:MAG TPA: SPASM domain-containing protein, partial [bacterium]|nr:SPASM domain-containing protein [bacterium]
MSVKEAFEKSTRYSEHMASDRLPYPETLILELTTRHASGCRCPKALTEKSAEEERDISPTLLEYIQTSILPYVQTVRLTGRGDPLEAGEALKSTIDAAREFSVPVIIDTHAHNINNDDVFNLLVSGAVARININLNAPDDASYNDLCGCSIEPLLGFLKRLQSEKKELTKPELTFKMVATSRNIELLPEVVAFAQNHGAQSLVVVPMSLTDDPERISAFRYHRDLTEEVMYRTLIEAEMSGFELKTEPLQLMDAMGAVENIEQFLAGQVPPEPDSDQWTSDCSCIWNHAIIDAEGNLLPCYGDFPPVGNVSVQAFQEIWFGDHMRAMRQNLLSGGGLAECSQCNHLLWRKQRSPKSAVQPDDDVFHLFAGWFDPELEEKSYRWTRDRAVAFLHRQDDHLFLVLQMRKAPFPKAPDSGKIIINHSEVYPFKLQSNTWETLEIPLPERDDDPLACVEIIPHMTVRPVDISDEHADTRSLGIKVGRLWLESWSKKVVFNKQLILLGYEVSPESWQAGGDVVFRTFWRTLGQTEKDMKVTLEIRNDDDDVPAESSEFGKLREDAMHEDFLLEHKGLASSNWPAGTFIAQETILPIPDNMKPGHYRIQLGLYPEGSPKKRLKIV